MEIASLVLGIMALFFTLSFYFSPIGIVLGIVGIILGAIGRKSTLEHDLPSGAATAGLVMSIIAVALGGLFLLACGTCLGTIFMCSQVKPV